MNRREFIVQVAAASATGLQMTPAMAAKATIRGGRNRPIYVDAQGGVNGFDEAESGEMQPSKKLVAVLRSGKASIVSQTIGPVGNGPDRFRLAVEDIARWGGMMERFPNVLKKIDDAADFEAARHANLLGVVYNFQDTAPLEGNADRVETFANLGVRQMQLTYNKRNLAGDGCLERANAGLSDFGREVIAKINQHRVLLDLSHAGQRTIAESIAAAKAPPSITHSGCRDLVDFPRNTYDTEMRALADKGGVFGIYLMPFIRGIGQPTGEDVVRHLEHAVNVCGEDHVGIGTDNMLLGVEIDDTYRQMQREFYSDRAKKGIAAPGEAAHVLNLVEDYNYVDRFDRIGVDLGRRGWSTGRVEKVLGGNFIRLYTQIWG